MTRIANINRIKTVTVVAFALMVASCSNDPVVEPTTTPPASLPATSTTTTTMAPTTTSTTTTTAVPTPRPLSGIDAEIAENQIVIAKYSNATKGRPPVGLNLAEMVVEVNVEGGVPRFLAFFQTEYPESIGPLRSLREVDPKLITPWDARVVSSGGQGSVRRAIQGVAVEESMDTVRYGYSRESGRPYLYSVMFDTAQFPDRGWDGEVPELLAFSDEPLNGAAATQITVNQSGIHRVGWEYDGELYLRSQNTTFSNRSAQAEHVDVDGDQITADSVVLLWVAELDTGRRDSANQKVPDFRVTGEGDVTVMRNGVMVEGTWQRETEGDWFTLTDEDGEEIGLERGRTWYHLIPTYQSFSFE